MKEIEALEDTHSAGLAMLPLTFFADLLGVSQA
jgi:hypothetical protein